MSDPVFLMVAVTGVLLREKDAPVVSGMPDRAQRVALSKPGVAGSHPWHAPARPGVSVRAWPKEQMETALVVAGWATIEPVRSCDLADLAIANTGVGNVEDKVGCGIWGRNRFSDNMNYRRHYLNTIRFSRLISEQVPNHWKIFGAFLTRYGAEQCAREFRESWA